MLGKKFSYHLSNPLLSKHCNNQNTTTFLSTNNKREKEREKKTKKLKKNIYIYISGRVIYYSRTIESIVPPSNVINIKILSPIKPSLMHGNGRRWSVKRQLSTLVRSIKDDNTWKLALFTGFSPFIGPRDY